MDLSALWRLSKQKDHAPLKRGSLSFVLKGHGAAGALFSLGPLSFPTVNETLACEWSASLSVELLPLCPRSKSPLSRLACVWGGGEQLPGPVPIGPAR